MIIYSDIMPSRFDGWTIGPVTIIRPAQRGNAGLHAHEAKHREQFDRNPLRCCLYPFNKRIRLEMEVEAYRAQIEAVGGDSATINSCATRLCRNYGLTLDHLEAVRLLLQKG